MADYIQTHSSIQSLARTDLAMADVEESEQLAKAIALAASEKKAGDIRILKVAGVSYLADYFVIATGYSRVQVRAIASAIETAVEEKYQRRPLQVEGKAEGSWVLHDYGEVIVHSMMPTEREFYNLEAFWGHAECIEFSFFEDQGSK